MALLGAAIAGPAAPAADRTLSFFNTHTNEQLTVTYKRDGRYVAEAMAQINHILRDWRRNEVVTMDPRLIDLAWEVYQRTGATQPIYIVCGYRAPETNAMLRANSNGVAENSQHMGGNALDFFIPGVSITTLRNVALQMQVGGVGFYPTSGSPFVHLDTGSVRQWPRMNRTQLAQVFPEGRSLYIPSDGQPLPGYAEAQAAYNARGEEVAALFGAPLEETGTFGTRLAALFEREPPVAAPTTQATTPAANPAATQPPVMMAAANPALTAILPMPRPDRAPIPGVTVAAAAPATTTHAGTAVGTPAARPTVPVVNDPTLPVMAYAAMGGANDPLALLNANPNAIVDRMETAAIGPAPSPLPAAARVQMITPVADPLARFAAPVMTGTSLPVFDATVTSRMVAFARIEAPATGLSPLMLQQPEVVLATGFAPPAMSRSDRFTGPLIRDVAMLRLNNAPAPTALAAAN